jgi:hypothetical protein
MKKIAILITLFLLVLQAAKAQNQKGDQNLGISLGFYTNNGNYNYLGSNPSPTTVFTATNSIGFSTNPNYSYFIANNLDIGTSIGFGSGTSNYDDRTDKILTKQVSKNYFGSVYLRKYFLYNNKIGIRTGPYLSYQYSNSNVVNTPDNMVNNNFNSHNYQAGFIADFVYYPASKLGLAVNLGNLAYNNNKYNSSKVQVPMG